MPLATGARLGRYVIDDPVGAGGMGEVYRARDTRLNRVVAIKILPPHLSSDPEGRRRFEREARMLATLSHPHICPIYDVGREEDRDYLVMEFLDGETLARRLGRGPLPIEEALRYAIAVAEGLAAAHANGIVHRDLKPGNVMLTAAGVKLVDFGIARTEPAASGATATVLTVEGSVVGTYEYMAPEQLQGLTVDQRADLFAFGVVLHEMLTGESPVARSAANPQIPAPLERFIAHCLAKQPDERWSSAHDAALFLRDVAHQVASDRAESAVRSSRGAWIAAALAAAVALGLAGALYTRPAASEPVRRLSVVAPPGTSFAPEEAPQISRDGTRLLLVVMDESGNSLLHVRPLDSMESQQLPDTDGASLPFWSPDGRGIGFFADGWLKTIDVTGGPARRLARAPTPRGASWREDGTILFVPFPALGPHRISAQGGNATPIHPRQTDVFRWFPEGLPGGDRYLYYAFPRTGPAHIAVENMDGSQPRIVTTGQSTAMHVPPGYLLFRRGTTLYVLPFDPASAETRGDPIAVVSGVESNPITVHGAFSASHTGVLAYLEATPRSQLTRVDRSGRRIEDLGAPGTYNSICASADGARVVADGIGPSVTGMDLWSVSTADPSPRRLTFHEAHDFYHVCAEDGSEVVFASLRDRPPNLYRMAVDSPGTETLLVDTPFAKLPVDWSADKRKVLFATISARGDWDLWVLPLDGDRRPSPVLTTTAEERDGRLSPDGRWLAYASNESGRFEVYVQSFPPSGPKWQISRDGGGQPQWRGDGRELFYLSADSRITAVAVQAGSRTFDSGSPEPLFATRIASLERLTPVAQYAAAADGRTFVVNALSQQALSRAVTVVLNWPALLQR
jgi:predicted Ser/Thr protein kinase